MFPYSLIAILLLLAWVGIMFFSYRRWKPWRHQGTWKQLLFFPFSVIYYLLLVGALAAAAAGIPIGTEISIPMGTYFVGVLLMLCVPAYIWFGLKYSDKKADKKDLVELSEDFLLIVDLAFFYNIGIGWLSDFPGMTNLIPFLFRQQNPFFAVGVIFFAFFLLGKQVWFGLSMIDLGFPRSSVSHFMTTHEEFIRKWRNLLLAPFGFASMICYILGYLTIPFFR